MRTCIRCCGTGKYLGQGFIQTHCTLCNENGMIPDEKTEVPLSKIDRRSESYKKAINDIMATNSSLTRKEAVKLFNEAYEK